ncbi:excisionase family DNA-binding protein [Curtobacterium sp. Leaf261]|uniref:excisionase family DNA-binding protein n=1 Tax=Curtobacterium sp. Leaf261 TaxID=1736311 RepID=UPI0007011FA9|nr:excisionase family DNA-binding protein [Curtobacterium sp. Leaf261]KQO59739.1 hypothetical protein ASF23_15730 [Curtobacterium sp. Leaf261]
MTSPDATDTRTTVLPPKDLAGMAELSRFLEDHTEPALLLGPDGRQVPLPMEVYEILEHVVAAMSANQAITVAPLGQQLTTQTAADLLGISRPTLIKLLDQRELPYDRPTGSRHRRIRLADLLAYRARRGSAAEDRLAAMTMQAAAAGLWDVDASRYDDALREARGGQGH